MIKTILISSTQSAQGTLVAEFPDGRIQINVGNKLVTGFPPNKKSTSTVKATPIAEPA